MTTIVARYATLVASVGIGLALAAAQLAGGDSVGRAALTLVIVVGWGVGVTLLGRRSETASTLAGRPIDERWEHINLEASTAALAISGLVALGAFVVTEATGGTSAPFGFMAAVIGVSYLGSLLVARARH